MSTKARLISTISAICLILALLVTGVWAVSTANVTLGGTISFKADNVHATVTGTITGTQETITLPDLEYKADTDTTSTAFQSNVEKWSNNKLTFTSENLITMTITVTNLSTERSLYVKVTDNTTTSNINKTFEADQTGAESGEEYQLVAGDAITYTMTMSVDKLDLSASATYAYDVDLRDANSPKKSDVTLEYDAENNYYYVTMGTYGENSAPVRWRYISADGVNKFEATSTAPTIYAGDTGYFIQETVTTGSEFGENDYGDSGIYYTYGTVTINTALANYATTLSISENDVVYSKIQSRSITELRQNSVWAQSDYNEEVGRDYGTFYDEELGSFEEDVVTSEKFWLPSLQELYTLLAGEKIVDNKIDYDTVALTPSTSIKNSFKWSGGAYYTRTANDEMSYHCAVSESGQIETIVDNSTVLNLRPAFVLTF